MTRVRRSSAEAVQPCMPTLHARNHAVPRKEGRRRWGRAFSAATLASLAILAGCAAGGGAPKDIPTASDQTDVSRSSQVHMELAMDYFARGQSTTALDEVKQAIAASPSMPGAYNLRGLIYASLGDDPLAEESFRYALKMDRNDAGVMHNYGWYLCQKKRFDEATQMFNQALAVPQYRDSVRTMLAQGVCQARNSQLPDAERTLMRAYELDPASPTVAVNLAEVLLRRGELDRARFYIRRVNEKSEFVTAQTLWLAARIENRLGNRQNVEVLGRQLRDRFPQSREALSFDNGKFDE